MQTQLNTISVQYVTSFIYNYTIPWPCSMPRDNPATFADRSFILQTTNKTNLENRHIVRLSYLVHAKNGRSQMKDQKQTASGIQSSPCMHGPSRCCHMFVANLFKQSQVVLIVIICKIHQSTAVAVVTSQPLEACVTLHDTPELELHGFSFSMSNWCSSRRCSIQVDRIDPTSLEQLGHRSGLKFRIFYHYPNYIWDQHKCVAK